MFVYEKKYTQIMKKNQKIAESGMLKLSAWDKRIKVDLFMDYLPFGEQIEGMCYLTYCLENAEIVKMNWPVLLTKKQSHYTYQRPAQGSVAKIYDCYIKLDGEVEIHTITNENAVDQRKESEWNQKNEITANYKNKNLFENREKNIIGPKKETMTDNKDEYENEDKNEDKNTSIRYVRDLKELLKMGEPFSENYYNSFLLHGFYQYRHVILGNGFLGVPGNFYEREAIAAKMMGFSFFLEKENIQNLNSSMLVPISSSERRIYRNKPNPGTYGYYLKKMTF